MSSFVTLSVCNLFDTSHSVSSWCASHVVRVLILLSTNSLRARSYTASRVSQKIWFLSWISLVLGVNGIWSLGNFGSAEVLDDEAKSTAPLLVAVLVQSLDLRLLWL